MSVDVGMDVNAIISEGCEFKGKMTFEGVVRIGGRFDGEIFSNDTLILEDTALVYADIEADIVIVSGELYGNVTAKSRVEIKKPAIVKGNITSSVITIEEGVIFEGQTKML
jgi:cytoskeletal protein CcmA (bactofilin family)